MTTFRPSVSLEMLRQRHRILQQVRAFFDERGFTEVCTPLLSQETFADRYLEPFRVRGFTGSNGESTERYLQTSPELAMKRIVAAGGTAIYQITQAFRAGERGKSHNPEFTILEWYRTDQDYAAGRQFLADFLQALLPGGPPCRQISYRELFQGRLGIDPHSGSLEDLARACLQNGMPTLIQRGDMLDGLMAVCVEPSIDPAQPLIVYDFPEHQSALARLEAVAGTTFRVAKRFEAYFAGLELANGYFELTDGTEFENRHLENCRAREQKGRDPFPIPARFAEALHWEYPASVGVAVGVDRLVMAITGSDSIDSVIPFPFENA